MSGESDVQAPEINVLNGSDKKNSELLSDGSNSLEQLTALNTEYITREGIVNKQNFPNIEHLYSLD